MGIPLKTRNKTTIWPNNPIIGIHPEKTIIEKDTCTPVFTAAWFTVARTWKQPRCPSTDEWIKKLWYMYTKECYSAIKRNAFESVLMRWMNLEPIIQNEINQKEKNKHCILTHKWNPERWYWWTYLQGSSGDIYTEQTCGHRGGEGWTNG